MWTRKTQVFLIMKLLGYILFFPKSMLVHITEVKCPMQHEADQRIARKWGHFHGHSFTRT